MKLAKFIFVFLIVLSGFANAGTTIDSLNVQGFMKKGNGTAVTNGTYSLVIGVFQNGTAIWAKEYLSVGINNGLFSQNLSGAGSNLLSLTLATGMNSDFSLVTLSPLLLHNATTGSLKIRIYAASPIDTLNPQFDINLQSVPTAFLASVANSVANNSIILNSLSTSVYSQSSNSLKLLQLN